MYVCIYIILPVVEDYLDTGQRGHSAWFDQELMIKICHVNNDILEIFK